MAPRKTPAKKILPKKPTLVHHKWPVYWVRALNGDEFISYAKIMKDGIQMMDPTIVTGFQNQMILAPYGMMSSEPGVFLQNAHVVHANEVTDIMKRFYEASVETSWKFCQSAFDQVVAQNIDAVVKADYSEEPTADSVIVTQAGRGNEINIDSLDGMKDAIDHAAANPWSAGDAIDNLVKLADASGKGKKKS